MESEKNARTIKKKLHLVRPLSILENITAIQMKYNNLKKK
jgi:hypothetical protein